MFLTSPHGFDGWAQDPTPALHNILDCTETATTLLELTPALHRTSPGSEPHPLRGSGLDQAFVHHVLSGGEVTLKLRTSQAL